MKEFELIFYKKANGDCPVSDFLSSLNKVMLVKMFHQLEFLEQYGNNLRNDSTKFVRDGIFEVRAQNKTDITRIFFFFDKNRQIVMTNGFIKKTQQLPAAELETAKRYRSDYLDRAVAQEKAAQFGHAAHIPTGSKWRQELDDIVAEAQDKRDRQGRKSKNKSHDRYR